MFKVGDLVVNEMGGGFVFRVTKIESPSHFTLELVKSSDKFWKIGQKFPTTPMDTFSLVPSPYRSHALTNFFKDEQKT